MNFTLSIAKSYQERGQERAARAYLGAGVLLSAFCEDRVIYLKDITTSLMQDFEKRLQNDGLTCNTTAFYMRQLRTIYNKAIQMKRLKRQEESPFGKMFTGIDKTRNRALTKK